MRSLPSSGFTSLRMGHPALSPCPSPSPCPPPCSSPAVVPGAVAVPPAAAALSKSGWVLSDPPGRAELQAGGSGCRQWGEAQPAAVPIVPALGAGLGPAAPPSAAGHFVSAFVLGQLLSVCPARAPSELPSVPCPSRSCGCQGNKRIIS